MIYVTGDCHADFHKFSSRAFRKQKEMTRDDFVIVCGDFGIWSDVEADTERLDWLSDKPFTLLFVDGNHEDFDRLYGEEFEVVDFHGGRAHKIRENIYHLIRGYIFNIDGKNIFAFGGASSHDIQDGILEPSDYEDLTSLARDYNKRTRRGEMLRINHISWWKEEMPSDEEMEFGLTTLSEHQNKVDFIISHCCPQHVASTISKGVYQPDKLTAYFDKIADTVDFSKWFFGHYHRDMVVSDKYIMLYHQITQIA